MSLRTDKIEKTYISLKEWAESHDMGYFQAHHCYRAGIINGAEKRRGRILIKVR